VSDSRPKPATAKRRSDPVTLVAILLGARALWAIEAMVLANASLFALGVQAVTAELAGGRLGVAWSDPHQPEASTRQIVARSARGLLFGLGVASLVLLAGVGLHRATVTASPPAFAALGLGLVTAGLAAARDELLLRGAVLRLVGAGPRTTPRSRKTRIVGLVAVALVGAANAFGEGGGALAIGEAALLAVIFGSLWLEDRGAFRPIGAHLGWSFTAEALTQGGWLDARSAAGATAISPFEGPVALVALAIAAVVTAAVVLREEPATSLH
jgi:hypothetical protein